MRLRLALSDTKTSHAPCVTALRTGSVTAPACAHVAVTRNGTTASVLCLRPEQAAGLSPEIEKSGLLPPRPEEHGGPEDGSRSKRSPRSRCLRPFLGVARQLLTWL